MPEKQPQQTQDDYKLGSTAADFLDINGGLVLTVVGVALLIMGAVLANQPTVAPFFVSFGSVLVILGAFYSRIEGRLDAGRGGLKTIVASVRKRASEADLPPQAEVEAVQLAVERYSEQHRSRRDWRQVAEKAVSEAVAETEKGPTARAELLMKAFEEWLLSQGFVGVDRARPGPDRGYDLAAFGWEEVLLAQIRLTRRIASGPIRAFSGISIPDLEHAYTPERGSDIHLRRALVTPSGTSFTQAALDYALKAKVELYEVDEEGEVAQVQPHRSD